MKFHSKIWNSFSLFLLLSSKKNDEYVKSALHSLLEKLTEHLWKDQDIHWWSLYWMLHWTDHLKIKRHDEDTKKMTYLELWNCHTIIWELDSKASFASNAIKIDRNRFVVKSFFRIVHSMIIKNRYKSIILVILLILLLVVVVKKYPLT